MHTIQTIVIVAPSGTGKSTLIQKIKEEYPQLEESISYTTRLPRPGEINGKNYFFINQEDFIRKRERGDFLEWALVHSHFYGTAKNAVLEQIAQGKVVLLDLDVQGAKALKSLLGARCMCIFIEPPSVEELKRRLLSRATDRPEVIAERIINAERELLAKNDFDVLVMNDHFNEAYARLTEIVYHCLYPAKSICVK